MAVSEDHTSCWLHKMSRKANSGFLDSSKGVGQKGRKISTNGRYRAGTLDGHRNRSADEEVTASEAQLQRVTDLTKKGIKWEQGM